MGALAIIHNKLDRFCNNDYTEITNTTTSVNKYKIELLSLSFITCMSMCAVLLPGKGFEHYYLLIVFPLAYFMGSVFISIYKALKLKYIKIVCLAAFAVITILTQLAFRKDMLLTDVNIDNSPSIKSIDQIITSTIKEYTRPGEKMVVWGWADKYYVYTQLIRGCRTEFISFIHGVYGNQQYYYKSFYNELIKSHSPVILDTVAPNQIGFNDKSIYGFENYPEIAEYIHANYSCIKDIDGNRIFISKQRLHDLNLIKSTN
jgi:hypothetical protein